MCTSPFCVCTISVHLLTKYISKRGSYKWTVHEVFVIACVCIFVLHFCRTRNKIHKESKRMITGQFNAMVVFVLCSCWLCVWVCCPQISVGITARAHALLCLSFVFVTSGLFCVCKTTRSKTHKESSWNNCTGRFTGCDHSVPTVLSCNGVCPIHHHRPPAICLGPIVCFFGQTPLTPSTPSTTKHHTIQTIHKHKHHPPASATGYLSQTLGLPFWASAYQFVWPLFPWLRCTQIIVYSPSKVRLTNLLLDASVEFEKWKTVP